MSEIIQYVSLGFAGIGIVYSAIIHFLHKNNNQTNDIQNTIKFQNLDQNISSIKELFQKLIKSNLFQEAKTEIKDLENQVKDKVENIVNFDFNKIKDVVKNEKTADRETVITKVSNMLQLSQNIQNHIDNQTQQTSNNALQVRNTLKEKSQKISVYEIQNK
uniref:Tlr 4Rp protein n=1 Tax=Tetrahymena thermophila TaxID=5911 RepID=Q8WR99_TETTH|nr:Tlr 4Rp protein [Tetrahymena thermophila]